MSTIDVPRKARLRDEVAARGGDLLDCPISGTPGMVAPRQATTFASGDPASVELVRPVLDAISGPWVYTGPFGTGAHLKYIANLLLAVHTVAAAEAMALARRSGLDLGLVQQTLDNSIAGSTIWKLRGPLMAERRWSPAPGPVATLQPILEQIEAHAADVGLTPAVFAAAKEVFDKAHADGWGHLDIASVHDQVSGRSALGEAAMNWSLASYTADGTEGLGILYEDGTLVTPADLKHWSSAMELIDDWPAAEPVLRDLDLAGAPPAAYDRLLAPLRWPRKVICAGVNYRRHMAEMGGEIPAEGWRPFFFLKAPTTSVIGPYDPIVISAPGRARYDWEIELAVIIGTAGKNIEAERALAHVAGYCVTNDVTARGFHQRDVVPADAFRLRLVRGQVHRGLAAARPGPDARVPGARSAGPAAAAVGERRAAAGRVHRRHVLLGRRADRGGQRGGHPRTWRRHRHRHPVRGRCRPGPVPARRRRGPRRHRRPRRSGEHRVRRNGGSIMIFVSHQLPVNVPGEPQLTPANVWDGLVLKANNALPFVPSMTYCEVTQRHSDTVFDRDIDFRGERFTERITLEAPHRVTFTRIAGPVLGTIANEIEGPADDLKLRFSFALVVHGVEGGSAEEQAYADSMTGDYLKAVAATLNAMRRIAAGAGAPVSA